MTTSACCVWDFTCPRDIIDQKNLASWLRAQCKKFTFQGEIGESGYRHWQGRFSLKVKERKTTLVKKIIPGMHVSVTSDENKDNMFYVMKEETREDGPWTDRDREVFIPRQYRGLLENLRPYQKYIWDSFDIFESRKINLIIDHKGAMGKSTIASLCDLHGRGVDLPVVNDAKQLIESVCDILMGRDIRSPGVMFLDMPRAMKQDKLRGIYTALEQIKKGKVVDLRYHYKEWWFDSPQIWVFTNEEPKLKWLTHDRWVLWSLSDDWELIPYSETNGIEYGDPLDL